MNYRIAGGYISELEKIISSLNLNDCIQFCGKISEEEKIREIKDCDVFVMPCYEIPSEREVEGFGIVYLEANSLGKFVIAGNCGGVSEVLIEGVTGYLVDGKDPAGVETRLFHISQNLRMRK